MIHEREGFVRLPDEQILYTSPARTSLAITTPRTYPGNNPLAIRSDTGIVYLTNRRVGTLASTLSILTNLIRWSISPQRLRKSCNHSQHPS